MKCPNCNEYIKKNSLTCFHCGYQFNEIKNDTIKTIKIISYIFWIIFFGPIFIVGILFTCTSLYCIIHDAYITKGYEMTNAYLVNTGETLVYRYNINGYDYLATTDYTVGEIEEQIRLEYNPNNPEEYYVSDSWVSLLIGGLILVGITFIYFPLVSRKFKPGTGRSSLSRQ